MGEDEIKNDEEAGPSSGKKEKNGRLIDDEDNTEGKSNHDQRDNEHDAEDARSYTDSSVSYRSRASGRSIRNNKSRKQTELRISERRSEKGDGPERKRRVRRGRVRKPRRSVARKRYHPVRRGDLKRRPREDSLSSFGARSSRSIVGVASRICAYCGHRCCSRRCKGNIGTYSCRRSPDPKTISRQLKKNRELKSKKNKRNIKLNAKDRKKTSAKERNKAKRKEKVVISDGVQKGSRSKMLSPLFVSTNERLGDDGSRDDSYYLEITPEMICDTVEKLTKWRQSIPIEPIANHILQRHPVNPDKEMLIEELSSKLAVATITGLLDEEIKRNVRQWRLSCEILRRGLTVNQVTLFWKIYCDTMQPIRRRILGNSGISQHKIRQYLADKKAYSYKCNKCNSPLPVSRCLSRYLWSTPYIHENLYVKQSDRCNGHYYRYHKATKRNLKHSPTRKAYRNSLNDRKLRRRPTFQGMSKQKIRKSRKQKIDQRIANIAKKEMLIYDLEHQNSLQVYRKRQQQLRSENDTDSDTNSDNSDTKTTQAVTIKDSPNSVPEDTKKTSDLKEEGMNNFEIVTIQEAKQTAASKSSEYLFNLANQSLKRPTTNPTTDNNDLFVVKDSDVEITHSKGRISSKSSCHQIQTPIEKPNDIFCCIKSLQHINKVSSRNDPQNSFNNLRDCRTEGNIALI